MSDAVPQRARGKTEVLWVVNARSPWSIGCWQAWFEGAPHDRPPMGLSAISAEAAIADLYDCAAWLNARAAQAAQPPDPVQDLMRSAADLTAAVSRLGWRFRSQPAIMPDGDVQMTLYRAGESATPPG